MTFESYLAFYCYISTYQNNHAAVTVQYLFLPFILAFSLERWNTSRAFDIPTAYEALS